MLIISQIGLPGKEWDRTETVTTVAIHSLCLRIGSVV